MPRQARTKSESGIYHIMLRGINQQQIFEEAEDYCKFLDILKECKAIDEYVVAMRCGPDDYHFIRLDENGWYNKSGTMPGLLIDQSMVESYYWFGAYPGPNGELCLDPYTYYEGEVIYFAVKEGWDDE